MIERLPRMNAPIFMFEVGNIRMYIRRSEIFVKHIQVTYTHSKAIKLCFIVN